MLSLFQCVCVCQCECRSVSVEVSVFKGFSGRTLRNAFGKKTRGLMYAQPGKLEFKRTLLLFLYIERRCVNGRRSALLAGT